MTYARKGKFLEISVTEKNKTKLLESAAHELFSYMLDLRKVHDFADFSIELRSSSFEMLILDWLNELVEILTVNGYALRKFKVLLSEDESGYRLSAKVLGEPLRVHHRLKHETVGILPKIEYSKGILKFLIK